MVHPGCIRTDGKCIFPNIHWDNKWYMYTGWGHLSLRICTFLSPHVFQPSRHYRVLYGHFEIGYPRRNGHDMHAKCFRSHTGSSKKERKLGNIHEWNETVCLSSKWDSIRTWSWGYFCFCLSYTSKNIKPERRRDPTGNGIKQLVWNLIISVDVNGCSVNRSIDLRPYRWKETFTELARESFSKSVMYKICYCRLGS